MAGQRFGSAAAVGHVLAERSKSAAGTNHWIKQSAGGGAVAKFQAVGDDALDSEVLRQRTHHVLERLADQNHVGAGFHKLLHCPNTFWLQARLELVLKILFSQKVQTVAGYAAQDCVDDTGGELAVGGIKNGAQHGHQKDEAPTPEALGEGLRIPGEERHRPDHGQVQQAALNPPVDGGGRTGVVV